MLERYFNKNGRYQIKVNINPVNNLGIIVVIPSYNEPDLEKSLLSLLNCEKPKCSVEVITVINFPEGSDENVVANSKNAIETIDRIDKLSNNLGFRFFSIFSPNLSKKHAGVGLARKIGMDEAAWRFFQKSNPNGIIACFDADATCQINYLVELEKLWKLNPKTTACSIRYEHPLTDNAYDHKVYSGIVQYELHLRYYYQASKYIKFPFAYHTIGSSMACNASTYIKFGGMNKNQAGEDFYFLQKIIPHGDFKELNTTCVYPSPRESYRVPFGTGRAMTKFMNDNTEYITTYNLDSFISLIPFFKSINEFYSNDIDSIPAILSDYPIFLSDYLLKLGIITKIQEIRENTKTQDSFIKRFYLWFDAFQLLKYLNYVNENHFERQNVTEESKKLLYYLERPVNTDDPFDLLKIYRELELG